MAAELRNSQNKLRDQSKSRCEVLALFALRARPGILSLANQHWQNQAEQARKGNDTANIYDLVAEMEAFYPLLKNQLKYTELNTYIYAHTDFFPSILGKLEVLSKEFPIPLNQEEKQIRRKIICLVR